MRSSERKHHSEEKRAATLSLKRAAEKGSKGAWKEIAIAG
jgi:hypothetical protein